MGKIAKYLNQLTVGNVFDTPDILEAYSTDHSILKIKPKFVAFPESTEDICKLMKFFDQLAQKDIKVGITVRGSGLDDGGADLSNGVVLSTAKLNRMLEIDPRERLVRVQAGMTLKELNTALSVSGLTVPIDGHNNDTIGGLIANCPVDTASHKYGGIRNYVERIEVVLPNGDCIQTSRLKKYVLARKAAEKTVEGTIYRKIAKLLKDKENVIRELDSAKSLAGYPNITKVKYKETLDLMPLFFGSQGTLGVISEVILRTVPLKTSKTRVVGTFKEIGSALKFLQLVSPLKPRKLDLYDLRIIMEAKESGKNLDGVIRKFEEGYVVFACFDEKGGYNLKKIAAIRDQLPRSAKYMIESPESKLIIDEFENSLTHYLQNLKDGERVPILTGFYLPEWNIESFLRDLKILGAKLNLTLELYGSYANSIYNLRPKFNLSDEDFNKKAATFLKAGAYIIDRQSGELAAGTPEGRLKAIVTNEAMIEPEKDIYQRIKDIFDPNNILNPDVKLGASSKFTLTHFRNEPLPKILVQYV